MKKRFNLFTIIALLAAAISLSACQTEVTPGTDKSEEPLECTVSFSANGGSGTMQSVTVPRGTVLPLAKNAFSKEGNMFVSWNTSAEGNGTAYTDETGIIVSRDITLYAQWAVPHTVTYHQNVTSGDETTAEQTVPERIYTPLDQSGFTNGDQNIAYWTTASDGRGTK